MATQNQRGIYLRGDTMPLDLDETKECPVCGKRMIKELENVVYPTYPPKRPWRWWCGCGHSEPGGVYQSDHPETLRRRRWEGVQR